MSAPFKWMHDVSLLIYLICCIFLSHYLYRAKLVGNLEEAKARIIKNSWIFIQNISGAGKKG